MFTRRNWWLAWRYVRARWLESLLLVVSIAFGVVMLATILSVLGAGQRSNAGWLNAWSARELTVVSRENDFGAFYRGSVFTPARRVGREGEAPVKLAAADLDALRRAAPAVQYAYLRDYSQLAFPQPGEDDQYGVLSVTPEYLSAANLKLSAGTLPSAADFKEKRKVVLLSDWASKKFGAAGKVGQTLQGFKVIGVFKPGENDQEFGQGGYLRGLVPRGATQSWGGVRELYYLPFAGQDSQAREQLGQAVRARWGERVVVGARSDSYANFREMQRKSTLSLGLLGSGGLLASGLGVLSLLLARVLSRQRQLAVSGALGASRAALRAQVLVEALLLGLLGSALGLLASGLLLPFLARQVKPPARLDLLLSPQTAGLVALGALLLTLLFALYPALVAARVRPGEVLRG